MSNNLKYCVWLRTYDGAERCYAGIYFYKYHEKYPSKHRNRFYYNYRYCDENGNFHLKKDLYDNFMPVYNSDKENNIIKVLISKQKCNELIKLILLHQHEAAFNFDSFIKNRVIGHLF